MMSFRDSVIPVDDVEVVQFRRSSRRYSQLVEDTKRLAENAAATAAAEKRKLSLASQAPDGGYGWVIVLCSFMLNLIIDGIALSQGIFVEPILSASQGKITEFAVGFINGFETGVTLLVGPVASVIVNRYGYRVSVIIGTVISSLGVLLAWATGPHSPNIFSLIIFYGIVFGVGHGLVFAPSVVIVTHYFNKKRALATGMAICGTGMGTFIMSPLSAYLIEQYTWSGALIGQSCIVLICLIFGALMVPPPSHVSTKRAKKPKSYSGTNSGNEVPEEKEESWRDSSSDWNEFKEFLTSPTYWIIALSGALIMLGFFVPFYFLPERAKTLTSDRYLQSYLLSSAGIANVIGRILFGFLSDRPWVNNLVVNNVALTIGGIATALSPLIQDYYLLVIYCAIFGLCIACFATLRSILIFEFIGAKRMNNGFGLSLMFMGITSLFGTPLAGLLRDMTDSYELSFVIAGLFILISGMVCYPLRWIDSWEKGRKQQQLDDQY